MAKTASDRIRVIKFDRDGDLTPTTRRLVSEDELALVRRWAHKHKRPLPLSSVTLTPRLIADMRAFLGESVNG